MAGPVVPYLPLLREYHREKERSTVERLAWAKKVIADDGAQLQQLFADSVAAMTDYYRPRPDDDFAAGSEHEPHIGAGISKANTLVHGICEAKGLGVTGRDDLGASYVNYEVSVLRTTGSAQFVDGQTGGPLVGDDRKAAGKAAGGAVKVDLLLKSADAGVPVIAEVKYGGDKGPIAALLQALLYVAALSSPAQHARLRKQYPGRFPEADVPRFDLAIVISRPKRPSRAYMSRYPGKTFKAHLWHVMPALIELLQAEGSPVAKHVRRIYGLEIESNALAVPGRFDDDGRVAARLINWVADADGP